MRMFIESRDAVEPDNSEAGAGIILLRLSLALFWA